MNDAGVGGRITAHDRAIDTGNRSGINRRIPGGGAIAGGGGIAGGGVVTGGGGIESDELDGERSPSNAPRRAKGENVEVMWGRGVNRNSTTRRSASPPIIMGPASPSNTLRADLSNYSWAED